MKSINKSRQTSPLELLSIAQRRLNTMLEAGTTTLEIKSGYGLRLEDELKILRVIRQLKTRNPCKLAATFLGAHSIPTVISPEEYAKMVIRSEEHTSELQSRPHLVCRLLLEKSSYGNCKVMRQTT